MALETGVTYIEDLNVANPEATDAIAEGDDHIRNIKTAVNGSFPNLGAAAVTKTAAQLNTLATLAGIEVLTNKTLTSPVINTGVNGSAIDTTITTTTTKIPHSNAVKIYADAIETALDLQIASLNTKILNISSWNMDTLATATVAHGVTFSKIRSINVIIINNAINRYYDFGGSNNGLVFASSTLINLERETGGEFDSSGFTTAEVHITIQYTD